MQISIVFVCTHVLAQTSEDKVSQPVPHAVGLGDQLHTDSNGKKLRRRAKKAEYAKDGGVRSRRGKLSLRLLKNRKNWKNGVPEAEEFLQLRLFRDVIVLAELDEAKITDNGVEWMGHVQYEENNPVVFVKRGKSLIGEVSYRGSVYKIQSLRKEDKYLIKELDPSVVPFIGEENLIRKKHPRVTRDFKEAGMAPRRIKDKIQRIRKADAVFDHENWITADIENTEEFVLNLFDDTNLVAIRDRVKSDQGGYEWVGHIEDYEDSLVLIVKRGQAIYGKVAYEGRNFIIQCDSRGLLEVTEVEPTASIITQRPKMTIEELRTSVEE